ncbi:MAG: hypothetical protein HUJ51_02915 [Eggerthellaceae bacterium]|nr:hypothetical protein [Eggerthellaceae bacterium]
MGSALVHLCGGKNVAITGIDIYNYVKVPNCGVIYFCHSRKVLISDYNIVLGDDSICLKNHRKYAEFCMCNNVTVTTC